ncbi:uncharacterized protein [Magallana gigas]|uniref:uncharacterized protein n=1 Tax=Magallana gigas TaxID=29159 RepID=UPI003340DC45
MWFLDPFIDKLKDRSVNIPAMFKELTGYRNIKKQHQKAPQLVTSELKEKTENLAELLLIPWILCKDFASFYTGVKDLVTGLQKYLSYMSGMKERTAQNLRKSEPVRSFKDNWSLQKVGKVKDVKDEYKKLDDFLKNVASYTAKDLIDFEPEDKTERRKWYDNLYLSFDISLFTYRYGNYLGNVNLVWKVNEEDTQQSTSMEIGIVNKIRESIPKYATRQMQKDFILKYHKHSGGSKSILRNIYQFLTDYEYTPENKQTAQIDLRTSKILLELDDTELIFDLRKNNGKTCDPRLEPFWSELGKFLDEKSVVHERRHTDTQYMPFAMSVEDLRNQIIKRLPEGTPAPSTSWIRLNFCPSNPMHNSAQNYTGKFNVKFAVQQRLLRVQHADLPYGKHQFYLLKDFACKWRDHVVLQSLDDKAIVPIGEPGQAVSTGVRAHHGGLVSDPRQNLALDHDFHVAGIVPSVCFVVDVPENSKDSFYNGTVHVTVKEKVFEPSSPLRHSTETISIVRKYFSHNDVDMEKPILLRITDGGPDHRTTYRSVQLCCLLEFIALDLDFFACIRTAPSASYYNPAERCMSTLNIALQNVALQRGRMIPGLEMQTKSFTSLSKLRNAATKNACLKKEYKEAMSVPIEILKERFSRLKWKGESVVVHDAAQEDMMVDLYNIFLLIDDEVKPEHVSNLRMLKSEKIDAFLAKHAQSRHYSYQIKKCTEADCAYCTLNPPRLSQEMLKDLHFIPDPVLKEDGVFKSFEETYGTPTTDKDRPSLQEKVTTTERDKQLKNLLVATKVRDFVVCCECGKRRVVYSSRKLSAAEERALIRLQEELLYICGSPLFPGGEFQDKIVVREGINCQAPIETTYYAGKTQLFDGICFHCGDIEPTTSPEIESLKRKHGIVRPICKTCLQMGHPVVTRNCLKKQKTK